MSDVLDVVVDVLAAHRITKLVIEDEITADLRSDFLDRHDPATSKLGYLVTCPWCTGFWVSAGVVAARRAAPGLWGGIALALATSSAVGILYEHVRTNG